MPAISTLQVVLEAKTKPFEDSMRRAAGFTKGLKQTFGEGSGFGLLGKGLMGAGVIAGLTSVSRAFKDITGNLVEINTALSSGSITIDEWENKLLRLIPVLGNILDGLDNIADLQIGKSATIAGNTQRDSALEMRTKARRELLDSTDTSALGAKLRKINDDFNEIAGKINEGMGSASTNQEAFHNFVEALNIHRQIRDTRIAAAEAEEKTRLRQAGLIRDQEHATKVYEDAFAKFEPIASSVRDSLVSGSEKFKNNMRDAADAAAKGFLTATELQQFLLQNDPLKNAMARQLEEMDSRAAQIRDSVMTPQESMRASAEEIDRLFKNRLLTATQAAAAIRQLSGGTSIDLAGSALRGSQEAAGIMSGSRANEMQLDLQRQQTMQLGQMLGLSRDILDELQKWNAAKVIE